MDFPIHRAQKITPIVRSLGRCLMAWACAILWLAAWHILTPTYTRANTLPPGTFAGPCSAWTQVNDSAFGMPSNFDDNGDSITMTQPYQSEEGFEVVVFNGQLYVGMEADNKFGARVWRTRPGVRVPTGQADWEEVAANGAGLPFDNLPVTQNDHIDSLAVFSGTLYASTANGGSSTYGTLIYSSATGAAGSWTQVISPAGFGDTHNTNFKDMQVFQGWLCGGTQNWSTGAQVWCTQDGITWTQKNHGGFGITTIDTQSVEVWSGHVHGQSLYFGVQNTGADRDSSSDDVALLYRATSLEPAIAAWTRVYTAGAGSYRLDILGTLGDYVYISARSNAGITILRSITGDPGTWTQVNMAGMDGDANNIGSVVDGAVVYNGALYVAVSNLETGVEVWRTTGVIPAGGLVEWEQIGGSGLDMGENIYSELISFEGYLYAWTSNYSTGQQVLRTACPIVQVRAVSGTGPLDFPGVGATLTLTHGAADAITVSVMPGALPTAQTSAHPVARTYQITIDPATAAFSADLTLSYTDEELAASPADSTTLYLAHWNGETWEPCPESRQARNALSHTVTCRDVAAFSIWAIAGEGGKPSSVKLMFTMPAWGWAWLVSVLWMIPLGWYHIRRWKST